MSIGLKQSQIDIDRISAIKTIDSEIDTINR